MINSLRQHPFAVEAFFKSSIVLAFAAPKEELQHLIPGPLQIDTFEDKWGFIAVAMVETQNLRPKGWPKILGRDFFLIGYRVFVQYHTSEGKRYRGLYILRSETNKWMMKTSGNIFTHYNYRQTDIDIKKTKKGQIIKSKQSNFHLDVTTEGAEFDLPKGSPFSNWKEARRYAGPLPFTFTYQEEQNNMLIIKGVRSNWKPQPIQVNHYEGAFLEQLNVPGLRLANAFQVQNIPYYWEKGKVDPCKEENSKVYSIS